MMLPCALSLLLLTGAPVPSPGGGVIVAPQQGDCSFALLNVRSVFHSFEYCGPAAPGTYVLDSAEAVNAYFQGFPPHDTSLVDLSTEFLLVARGRYSFGDPVCHPEVRIGAVAFFAANARYIATAELQTVGASCVCPLEAPSYSMAPIDLVAVPRQAEGVPSVGFRTFERVRECGTVNDHPCP